MREGKSSSATLTQEPEEIAPTEREMRLLPEIHKAENIPGMMDSSLLLYSSSLPILVFWKF